MKYQEIKSLLENNKYSLAEDGSITIDGQRLGIVESIEDNQSRVLIAEQISNAGLIPDLQRILHRAGVEWDRATSKSLTSKV